MRFARRTCSSKCVVANARNTTVDDLFYAVFSAGDIEHQQIIMDLSKFGLENAFWKLSDSRFGYDDSNPSLLKFVMSLFAVYTFHDNLEVVPKRMEDLHAGSHETAGKQYHSSS